MSTTIRVWTTYRVSLGTDVELPKGMTVGDIDYIDMKWCIGDIAFKDGTFEKSYFTEDASDCDYSDYKCPKTLVFEDEDGIEYDWLNKKITLQKEAV